MNLSTHYNNLHQESVEKIRNNQYKMDVKMDDLSDNRFGITLLIRPPERIKNKIQLLLNELKEDNFNQYFYPNSDIHITILSIISCHPHFTLDQIEIKQYIHLIEKILVKYKEFEIDFKGIATSDSAILIQGFPANETLNNIRNDLRNAFAASNLKASIDSRYSLFTAHSTVCRFRDKIKNSEKLFETMDEFRNHSFGSFKIKNVELVYNDWYQKQQNTTHLHTFKLIN